MTNKSIKQKKPQRSQIIDITSPTTRLLPHLSPTYERRYRKFCKEYLNNGFNASKAYQDTYKQKDKDNAKVSAANLLTNINCVKVMVDELRKIGVDEYCSKEFIVQKCTEKLKNIKNEANMVRILELMSKIGHLTKDGQVQVAIFSDVEQAERAILKRRGLE